MPSDETDITNARPSLTFLLGLGFSLEHYPKSLRYHKRLKSGLSEVVVRASSTKRFQCEISKVTGPVVKSASVVDDLEGCVSFIKTKFGVQ